MFPEIKSVPTEPWKTLAKEVYKALAKLNSPILAMLTEEKVVATDQDQDPLYTIEWCDLLSPQAPNEGYFHSFLFFKSTLFRVLKGIGMNLVNTPQFICEQFKEIGIDLPIISEKSVLTYYIRFHNVIFNHNKLPCHVSNTRFKDVEQFITFVKYLSKHNFKQNFDKTKDDDVAEQKVYVEATKDDETDNFNVTLHNIGLLITVDEHVHCLSDGKKIISSHNWNLFPESKGEFLHKALIQCTHNLDSYIFTPDDSSEAYNFVHSIFAANLPPSWNGVDQAPLEGVDISWVKHLLTCIAEDPVFKKFQVKLLQDFTLIPADNNVLFSCKSKLLPMKTDIIRYRI